MNPLYLWDERSSSSCQDPNADPWCKTPTYVPTTLKTLSGREYVLQSGIYFDAPRRVDTGGLWRLDKLARMSVESFAHLNLNKRVDCCDLYVGFAVKCHPPWPKKWLPSAFLCIVLVITALSLLILVTYWTTLCLRPFRNWFLFIVGFHSCLSRCVDTKLSTFCLRFW